MNEKQIYKLKENFKVILNDIKKKIGGLEKQAKKYESGEVPTIYEVDENGNWKKRVQTIGGLKSSVNRLSKQRKKIYHLYDFFISNNNYKKFIFDENYTSLLIFMGLRKQKEIIFTNKLINDIVLDKFDKGIPKSLIISLFKDTDLLKSKSTIKTYTNNKILCEVKDLLSPSNTTFKYYDQAEVLLSSNPKRRYINSIELKEKYL